MPDDTRATAQITTKLRTTATNYNPRLTVMKNYLLIVGNEDIPLYEHWFSPSASAMNNGANLSTHGHTHAAAPGVGIGAGPGTGTGNVGNASASGGNGSGSGSKIPKDDLLHFILHSALDTVDTKLFSTSYLPSAPPLASANLPLFYRGIDKYNDYLISVFITFSQCKFLFVHESRMDENVLKNLLCEIFEIFLIYRCNPFVDTRKPIVSRAFDERIRLIGEKYIGK